VQKPRLLPGAAPMLLETCNRALRLQGVPAVVVVAVVVVVGVVVVVAVVVDVVVVAVAVIDTVGGVAASDQATGCADPYDQGVAVGASWFCWELLP